MGEIIIKKEPLHGPKKDFIRVKRNGLELALTVFNGKQGEFFVCFCPSINISGYGKTEAEAEDFIKIEMETFCEDIKSMSLQEREHYLISLGFKQEQYHKKNFSKAYVDNNGILQNFDKGSVKTKTMQFA